MIDLHIHTNYSDGKFSLIEILKKAQEKQLKCIAITDHDTTDAYFELEKINAKDYYTGKIINGIEIHFNYKNFPMEVLGYGIDYKSIANNKWLLKEEKLKVQEEILEKLFNIADKFKVKHSNREDITIENNFSVGLFYEDICKYKENDMFLKSNNIIDIRSFFKNLIDCEESEFFIDDSLCYPTFEEACKIIKEAGGRVFLAHIFRIEDIYIAKKILGELIDKRCLDGIECIHKIHNEKQMKYLINLCNKHNLLKCGGSDYHRLTDYFGKANDGKMNIPYSLIEEWI